MEDAGDEAGLQAAAVHSDTPQQESLWGFLERG